MAGSGRHAHNAPQDLIEELISRHQVAAQQVFVLAFLSDGTTEQYKSAKTLCMAMGIKNQVLVGM